MTEKQVRMKYREQENKKSPGEGEIYRIRPDRPWSPSSFLDDGYRVSFLRVKRPGRAVNQPFPSSAEVKERIELYVYSLSGPSGPVLKWILPYLFTL
jgi:hypothetical protein